CYIPSALPRLAAFAAQMPANAKRQPRKRQPRRQRSPRVFAHGGFNLPDAGTAFRFLSDSFFFAPHVKICFQVLSLFLSRFVFVSRRCPLSACFLFSVHFQPFTVRFFTIGLSRRRQP